MRQAPHLTFIGPFKQSFPPRSAASDAASGSFSSSHTSFPFSSSAFSEYNWSPFFADAEERSFIDSAVRVDHVPHFSLPRKIHLYYCTKQRPLIRPESMELREYTRDNYSFCAILYPRLRSSYISLLCRFVCELMFSSRSVTLRAGNEKTGRRTPPDIQSIIAQVSRSAVAASARTRLRPLSLSNTATNTRTAAITRCYRCDFFFFFCV